MSKAKPTPKPYLAPATISWSVPGYEIEHPQQSAGWFAARLGRATASRFGDVVTSKGVLSSAATRQTYAWQLTLERITNQVADTYRTPAMEHGSFYEAEAAAAVELAFGVEIEPSGFWAHRELQVGASPDGFIAGEGMGVEIKCPYNSARHLATIDAGKMPDEHRPQVQGGMWLTGLSSWMYVSFDPRLPPNLRLYTETIERDSAYIEALELALTSFMDDVDAITRRLLDRKEAP